MNEIRNFFPNRDKISVAEFMKAALFDCNGGYYIKQSGIGKERDFITAPEISEVFGRAIANYFFSFILSDLERGIEVSFVEMGAGNGTLFYDICRNFEKIAKKLGKFEVLSNLSLNIIEIGENLRKNQQNLLKNRKISWFETFEEFLTQNQNRKIYFLSNELFDCFEIAQFQFLDGVWREILIDLSEDSPKFVIDEFDEKKNQITSALFAEFGTKNGENGAIFEHSFSGAQFMEKLSAAIKENGGLALNIDYGYFENPLKSTLQALKNHQKTEVLANFQNCDLTSLVNFKMLETICKKFDLQSSLVTQGEFLQALGIEEMAQNYSKMLEKNRVEKAIQRLISQGEMGDLFKCHLIWA